MDNAYLDKWYIKIPKNDWQANEFSIRISVKNSLIFDSKKSHGLSIGAFFKPTEGASHFVQYWNVPGATYAESIRAKYALMTAISD